MFYGIDVGSTYTKIAGFNEEREIIDLHVFPTQVNPDEDVKKFLKDKNVEVIVSTGYGRYMIKDSFNCPVISEIKAHAKGAYHFFPDVKTVIDLGGQDSKVIKVDEDGNFSDFKMNDKCAAGTGKFLEIVASRLGVSLNEFASLGENADKKIKITSMCAVFAESEVISLLAKKESVENIVYGVVDSIADRLVSMVKSLRPEERIVFSGGGALNSLLVKLLGEKLGYKVYVPQYPQFLGAIGAAVSAIELVGDFV
ncbi:CoA-substrate-specific enzyme activase [Thermotomaculum hydrothermale]|uniref:CoA-substrate-specific enzyme activase n=1 Tax=Thermotomaculum hydrothermale TaxID=981385 RepID=A0A7R6SZ05_9BACT|nr:acyl-CoA dehydratase activase [Thermotomaculum hydrothermale]BBB33136.1 CoA-substrate-specific enzyme activase [Thermotomaculum hydrothermale]